MEIVRLIKNWEDVRNYLLSDKVFKQHAFPELAQCAKGRMNFWLNYEPVYSRNIYKKAINDERLWNFCSQLSPNADLAQVYYAKGKKGIDWHKDGSFALHQAFIFNMGKVRLQTIDKESKLISLNLVGGELVKFNCKLLHRAIPLSTKRVGIGMWSSNWELTFGKD